MNYTYVGVVLVRDDGAVLVQHRDNLSTIAEPNRWCICGGKREKTDDTDEVAAARELLEETGYPITPEVLKSLSDDTFTAGSNHITRRFYWAPYDGHSPIYCFEGQKILFVPVDELTSLDFCDVFHLKYLRQASEQSHLARYEGNRQSRR